MPPADLPIRYSEALLRQAARRWWWRGKGGLYWTFMAVVAAGYALTLWGDPAGWASGAYGALIVLYAMLMVAGYALPLRRSLGVFRTMTDGAATLRLRDDTFEIASAAGRVEIPWMSVASIDAGPDVWLVVYSEAQYSTLPAADLTPEARAFIAARVRAAGGRAAG